MREENEDKFTSDVPDIDEKFQGLQLSQECTQSNHVKVDVALLQLSLKTYSSHATAKRLQM